MAKKQGAAPQEAEHEEIIVLLPRAELPDPAGIDERIDANRYLIQALDQVERSLLELDHVGEFLNEFIRGLQSALGCSEAVLVMHDPVGQLQAGIERPISSPEELLFVSDASELYELFNEGLRPIWVDASHPLSSSSEIFSGWSEGYLFPVIEAGVLVGVVGLGHPSIEVVQSDLDLELLFRFIARSSLSLQRVEKIQQQSHLLHIDPVTRLSNRYGLLVDLEREIGRTHRADQPLGIAVLMIEGLEVYHNHARRHVESMILSKLATQVNASLRVTDTAARLDHTAFAVVLPNAPAAAMPDICWRYEKDLSGLRIDNGSGGFVEVAIKIAWLSLMPRQETVPTSELATRMVSLAINASDNGLSGDISAKFLS